MSETGDNHGESTDAQVRDNGKLAQKKLRKQKKFRKQKNAPILPVSLSQSNPTKIHVKQLSESKDGTTKNTCKTSMRTKRPNRHLYWSPSRVSEKV
jgi:hypothetical protein